VNGKSMTIVVIVSANAEWEPVQALFPDIQVEASPYGEYFFAPVDKKCDAKPGSRSAQISRIARPPLMPLSRASFRFADLTGQVDSRARSFPTDQLPGDRESLRGLVPRS
jgi:hypothetical protein